MTIADINTLARALVDADTTSLPAAKLLIYVNIAYEEIVGDLIVLNGQWKFDDSNYTNLPIGISTLVANQQDYSFDSSVLSVERVEVLDNSGVWHKLTLIDENNLPAALGYDSGVIGSNGAISALAEYKKTAGLPEEYAVRANSLFLYPKPSASNVTLASGLKVYFQRTADKFTSAQVTTGTKEPGFASPYHHLLSYKAALIYANLYKRERVPYLVNEISRLENKLFSLQSNKIKDRKNRLMVRQENNR